MWGRAAPFLLVLATALAGCDGLLDIDHIEFADGATSTADGGGASQGGGGAKAGGDGGGGSGGAAGAAETSCTNGVDDDGDALIDCADPDCATYVCASAPPDGWSGPALLYAGQPAGAPSCDATFATAIDAGAGTLVAPAASCVACSCSAPSGGTCGMPTIVVYDSASSCSLGKEATLTPNAAATCYGFSVSDPSSSVKAGVPPVAALGACAPSGGAETVSPVAWANRVVICADGPAGGGCGADVCAPRPSAPFGSALCVYRPGDESCPAGPYSVKTLAFLGTDDTRGCSPCGCDPAQGEVCAGSTDIYVGGSCQGSAKTYPNDGKSCGTYNTSQGKNSYKFAPSGPTGGSCAATGGEPVGDATPKDPVTVCCLAT